MDETKNEATRARLPWRRTFDRGGERRVTGWSRYRRDALVAGPLVLADLLVASMVSMVALGHRGATP
jgi:hypothetical protein